MPTIAMPLTHLLLAATPPAPQGIISTVWELTWKGGIVMIPIAIASLVAIAFAIERFLVLRPARVSPPGLLATVLDAAGHERGQTPAQAIERCAAAPSPLARVLDAGLRGWHGGPEQVERRLVEAGLRETAQLRARLRVLSFVVGVSPMLGLLGTIFGMITAFRTVAASPDALGRTELLAGGIYEALVTTAAGLIVAIPVMLLHWLLSAAADRRTLELDHACRSLVDAHPSSPTPIASPAPAASADQPGAADAAIA